MKDDTSTKSEDGRLELTKPENEDLPEVSFSEFLRTAPPFVSHRIKDLLLVDRRLGSYELRRPDVLLYCNFKNCQGERNFSCESCDSACNQTDTKHESKNYFLIYRCRNCCITKKRYSIFCTWPTGEASPCFAVKYGELPQLNKAIPEKLEALTGGDLELFRKGLKCESDGNGIAAFSYYRRVVENARDRIIDEIVKACRSTGESEELIKKIESQKGKFQFKNSVDSIKDLIPRSFYIEGHNPLTALHGALSSHIHERNDVECLQLAEAVRLVLSSLVERVEDLKKDHSAIKKAIGNLTNITSKKPG